MNCPGCHKSDWEYPDTSIARCKNCGYLLDRSMFGQKSTLSSPGNLSRSERSKRWAKITLVGSILLFIVSIWISDWFQLGIIALVASAFLFLDALMYS
jgi:hypothetical protein